MSWGAGSCGVVRTVVRPCGFNLFSEVDILRFYVDCMTRCCCHSSGHAQSKRQFDPTCVSASSHASENNTSLVTSNIWTCCLRKLIIRC